MATDQAAATALARELKQSFAGEVMAQGQAGYDEARTIWNTMVDKRPAVVALAESTEDEVAAVKFGGGRSLPASSAGGGQTIDLTRMRRVDVNAGERTVKAHSAGSTCWSTTPVWGRHRAADPAAESIAAGRNDWQEVTGV